MNINLSSKNLLTVVLLSGFCSFVAADTGKMVEGNNDLAPEATAADAKISFWDFPYLEKAVQPRY